MKKQAELIKSLTDRQLILNLYVTQGIILLLAIILSYIFLDGLKSLLDLIQWNDLGAYLVGISAGILIVMIDLVLYKVLPERFYDDGGINERIFLNRPPLQIFMLATVIGISEELLFRGVLQNTIGWIWTSLLFALIHFRYLSHWFLTVNITLLSFFIGYIYVITNNLIAPIVLHITVDFLLGLFLKIQKRGKEGVSDVSE
ncbi:CPBP family intramembrane metalloprotease [Bacillus carboniphilus]|uniref:CPBP family intramembrane metalloprotease n=1 Tax=Bacillus carboniphilus TaxID=86663 RepID=A0ABN0WUL6_9BACI